MKDVDFLDVIIRSLVSFPEDIRIDRSSDEMGVLLTLNVNPADMGKIIGREGSTATAIRTLLRNIGARNGARISLKIFDPRAAA